MTNDSYWDELGIAWCMDHASSDLIQSKLQARLRRQSILIMTCMLAGLLLGICGAALGAFTLWRGWSTETWNFVTRGIALLVISGIVLVAALKLVPVMGGANVRALPEMLDLNIARTRRVLAAIYLGLSASAVAMVLGLAGTTLRASAPAVPPILDVAILAPLALGLFLYGRRVNAQLAKFRYLRRSLAANND